MTHPFFPCWRRLIKPSIIRHATLVLDIGKTNAKLVLLDQHGAFVAERRTPNTIVDALPYPHHDTTRIWNWLLAACRELSALAQIDAIVPVTHGATAALVDDNDLVLPVLDYEFNLPVAPGQTYASERPGFDVSFSPALPAGLNLGRQLAWLAHAHGREFARARHILLYPQYWAWRLCGVAAAEITSLGCHTDLWEPHAQHYTTLVTQRGWQALFAPLRNAWDVLGCITPEVAQATGLSPACRVINGIHDSNASLLRHLQGDVGVVLSTGTWLIAASFHTPLHVLSETADMLANVNARREPVACMRFMGGREFSAIAGPSPATCTIDDIGAMVERGSMALPCFAEAGGPFAGATGRIEGPPPASATERYALATLYVALMSDYCLETLGATGAIVIEGSFTANPHFAGLLAALRPAQVVRTSNDASGTTCGGWMLAHWGRWEHSMQPHPAPSPAADLEGLHAYRSAWRARLQHSSIATIPQIN